TITFDSPYTVQAGLLYHIQFDNPDADPLANYVSLNGLSTTGGFAVRQPAISDQDLAELVLYDNTAPWAVMGDMTPIFSLNYQDGAKKGQGYRDTLSVSGVTNIGYNDWIRQSMTISGG